MLKRNVILGGLIAGAFLLPSVSIAAGVVSGPCVNCHTMHDSQNGTAVNTGTNAGQHAQLLKGSGCAGCHADPDANNTNADGTSTGGVAQGAPQVDYNSGSFVNAGGYFDAAGSDAHQHNVVGISSFDVAIEQNALVPGGSGTAYTSAIGCQDCHTSSGGHHNSSAGVYRMLANNAGTPAVAGNYNPSAVGGAFPGNRSNVTYNAANMNTVCANCHEQFHGADDQGATGAWLRHPTDIRISTASTGTNSIPATVSTTDAIVLGSSADGTETDYVMCLSCHVAHGGPYNDLLSFQYGGSGSYAGDSDATVDGCETCHYYGAGGM